MLNLVCAKQKRRQEPGGGGEDDTCDHGLHVQKLESRTVSKKEKRSIEEMINQQLAATSTSSAKQHKLFCQLRTNTTACTWPANDYSYGERDHSNNKACHPPKSLLGEKKLQPRTTRYVTNECHSLVSSVDTVDFSYDLRVAQLNNRRNVVFPPYFLCRKNVWYTIAPCHKICHRRKACCV